METETLAKELASIKRLLVLALLSSGLTQSQVGGALGIDRTGVGRMFPKGTLSGIRGKADRSEPTDG